MKLYIQINFGSGLGDFFAYFYEVYFFSKEMKNKGYNINIIIHTKNKINFKELFEEKYYNVFNSFEIKSEVTTHLNFTNYKVVNINLNSIGDQSWELFAPIEFNEPFLFKKFNLVSQTNYDNLIDFPKLNTHIIDKINYFIRDKELDDFVVIHFRDRDDIADQYNSQLISNNSQLLYNNLNKEVLEKLKYITQHNKKVFVCSNNIQIKILLDELYPNVIIYKDNVETILKRTYSDDDYFMHCITEFYIISKATKIFSFSNYSWVSNFLIYGLLHSKNKPINPNDSENNFFETCGDF
jgi:hypothetical protein